MAVVVAAATTRRTMMVALVAMKKIEEGTAVVATVPCNNIVCQICKREGHSAYTCWWRYADNDNDDEYDNNEKEVNAV
jgi:hypothetical protein